MIRLRLERRESAPAWLKLALAVGAILLTLVICSGLILLAGAPVGEAYARLFLTPFSSRFDTVESEFLFDAEDPTRSSVKVTIPVASLSTGVEKLDTHLLSADFFDAEKFPTATFTSTSVTAAGSRPLPRPRAPKPARPTRPTAASSPSCRASVRGIPRPGARWCSTSAQPAAASA